MGKIKLEPKYENTIGNRPEQNVILHSKMKRGNGCQLGLFKKM